jgi:hypothetical protein
MLLPNWPVFHSDHFARQTANLWEAYWARSYLAEAKAQAAENAEHRRASEMRGAHVEAEQGDLMASAIAKLAPRDPSKPNVYAIGVAGWGDQDVFMRETQQSLKIFGAHFRVGDHSVSLINNQATADELPMASVQNIAAALRAVALRMDREKDVLVLTLTSHGSPDGFALQYDDLVERTLDPQTLRRLLDEVGVKNRVVIVSSCYSGTFVPVLSSPDTMVLTAASADRTSFGCADGAQRQHDAGGRLRLRQGDDRGVGARSEADALQPADFRRRRHRPAVSRPDRQNARPLGRCDVGARDEPVKTGKPALSIRARAL